MTKKGRIMMIGLDAFELSIADPMIESGRLPTFRRLRESGANFLLDHGTARRTGLAWEHASSGLSPDDAQRWAAVDFDARTYDARHYTTRLPPFPKWLGSRTIVFDAPYFDLRDVDNAAGVVNWGAHDPGIAQLAKPKALLGEVEAKFGSYPAAEWIYGFTWASEARTKAAAAALSIALERRFDIADWLFGERLPDWDLAYMVVAEFHSATEPFWHGVDVSHPLHNLPSASPARASIEQIYEATDRRIGQLMERFPDATFVLFNMHGMGPNQSDIAGMLLLPELLYRRNFGRPHMRERQWPVNGQGIPMIDPDVKWEATINEALPLPQGLGRRLARAARRRIMRLLPEPRVKTNSLDWMPAARYRGFWPKMRAFAIPAYYDGRVRINLKGRERHGRVEPQDYKAACDEIEALVRECRDVLTGEAVVAEVERIVRPQARLQPSEADLIFSWNGAPLGFRHPLLGTIGPFPYRRTGGHTGGAGFAHIVGPGIAPGDYGTRSAFDVIPSVVELLGEPVPEKMSGKSFSALIEA